MALFNRVTTKALISIILLLVIIVLFYPFISDRGTVESHSGIGVIKIEYKSVNSLFNKMFGINGKYFVSHNGVSEQLYPVNGKIEYICHEGFIEILSGGMTIKKIR